MAPGVSKGASPLRILAVTGGLCLAGGLVGALVGLALVGIYGLVADGPGGLPFGFGYVLAAVLGAGFGGVLVPVSAWTLLRRVSFGRVFAVTALGTAAGCFAGLLASSLNPFIGMFGGVAGYCAAAAYLYWRSRRGRGALPQSGDAAMLAAADAVALDTARDVGVRSPAPR
jgi:hypothetical protein